MTGRGGRTCGGANEADAGRRTRHAVRRVAAVAGAWVVSFAMLGLGADGRPVAARVGQAPLGGAGLIVGRVVDAEAGAPVGGAIVELDVTPSTPPPTGGARASARGVGSLVGSAAPVRVRADDEGRFVFGAVSAGTCRLSVDAPDYLTTPSETPGADGTEVLTLAEGQELRDVVLKVWKAAAITGRVIDEAGEPVVSVAVRVLRAAVLNGVPAWQPSGGSIWTDDRGVYRAFGLRPGAYVVEVAPTIPVTTPAPQAGTTTTPGEDVGDLRLSSGDPVAPAVTPDGRLSIYPRTYYPDAPDPTHATVLALHSGDERSGVDLTLTLVPALRISGLLTQADGRPVVNGTIRLAAAESAGGSAGDPVALARTSPRGTFTFLGVPPGDYVIYTQGSMTGRAAGVPVGLNTSPLDWVRAAVSVADHDVSGLVLAFRAGLKVTGRVVFDGTSPVPTGGQLGRGLQLQPTSPGLDGRPPAPAVIAADGSFTTRGSMPGDYLVVASGWPTLNWIATAIRVGGRDVSDAPVDLEDDLANVVVAFTDRPAALAGTVRGLTHEVDPNALVVGFPVEAGWSGVGLHTFTTHARADGTYRLPRLAPGDYRVAAIPDALAETWHDPAVLARLMPSAVRVHLEAGAQATQDLATSPIR